MNARAFIACLFFVLPQVVPFNTNSQLAAQNINRDSLREIIANPPSVTADLDALRLLGKSYMPDIDSMLYYQELALNLAMERADSAWIARLRNFVGGTLKVVNGRFEEGLELNQAAVDFYKRHPDKYPDFEIEALVNQGVFFQTMTEYGKATNSYEQAYDIMQTSGVKDRLPVILNNLGIIHRSQGDYLAAVEVYRRSIDLKRSTGDSLGWARTASNMGVALMTMDSIDEARQFFDEARSLYLALGEEVEAIALGLNIGQALYQSDQPLEALSIWEKTLESDELKTDAKTIAGVFGAMSEIYQDSFNQLEKSWEYAKLALEYLPYSNDRRLEIGMDLRVGRLHQASGRYDSAAFYLERHASGRQAFYEAERIRNEQMMSERFQSALRTSELERQEAELAKQAAEIEINNQRRRVLILLSVALAFLALGTWLISRYRARLNKAEIARQEILQAAEIEQLQKEAKLGELRSMIEGQEAERLRVAKDLHDGLGGLLTTVKASVGSLRYGQSGEQGGDRRAGRLVPPVEAAVPATPPPAEVQKNDRLQQTEELIDRACTEVRRIAHNMLPQTLALSGLSGSLEDIQAQLKTQGFQCELEVLGQAEEVLDATQQSMLLRIVQELCQNIVKHAEAQEIFIQLLRQEKQLLLIVEDDGKGFNVKALQRQTKGLGMESIRQRVTYLKGELTFDSQQDRGTTVSVTVPLKTSMNS